MGILPQEELLGTVFNDHETDGDEWWLLKKIMDVSKSLNKYYAYGGIYHIDEIFNKGQLPRLQEEPFKEFVTILKEWVKKHGTE